VELPPPVSVSLAYEAWTADTANPAGINHNEGKLGVYFESGESSMFVVSQKLTGLTPNASYEAEFDYGIKHGDIWLSLDGETWEKIGEEWATEWTWIEDKNTVQKVGEESITANADGELTVYVKMTAAAYSSIQINSIILYGIV
jgi:hypothetical protein